jgi:NitT/TauT family transport system ATP-binding protein
MQRDLEELWATEKSTVLFVTHSISEAVLLSDRVLVFSNRPARIVADLQVNLPRPRDQEVTGSPEFVGLTQEIHALFRREGVLR